MIRAISGVVLVAAFGLTAVATTLERLTVEEMVAKSHLIVRAKVTGKSAAQRGSMIYTVYQLQVSERLKGESGATVAVSVPGGTYGSLRQSFAGTPTMETGTEYVVFIWRGQTGVLHIIGLSQGLFDLKLTSSGEVVLTRGVLDAELVDKAGRQVQSAPVALTLGDLRKAVAASQRAER